ncbi:hypothetical protein [Paenibacillus rhizolycopersici]|uniref:hypothetical protein n=1 Tax=Paenibacillus rhizolycopersici TaxID=2780073 RepID=UPI003D2BFD4D
MKLHKDGTIEGTPQELYLYSKLTEVKKEPFKVVPPSGIEYPKDSDSIPSNPFYPGGSGTIIVSTVQPKVSMSDYPTVADYVRGLMSAITNKGDLH